jgi:two-component system C4-dicarboxylate transport response regulator DctD
MISTETAGSVIFVDDDEAFREAHVQSLILAGLEPLPFADAASALAALNPDFPGAVVTDIRMPGMDGLQFFRRLRAIDPEIPVILATGHGDVPMAVAALKDGAWDFLTKPFGGEQLVGSIRRALHARGLTLDNRRLRAAAGRAAEGDPLVGETPVVARLRHSIRQLAEADVDVLVEGETGTGKELVARLLHRWSKRRAQPFVAVNCGALPATLAESELFGHRDGVVPGARLSREGRVEAANRGTLFLDEIELMPAGAQAGMLRVIEERELLPLGADEPQQIDIRIVAAAKEGLAGLTEAGRIRADFYHRLAVVRLQLPPLRERRDDVPLLFAHFQHEAAQRYGRVVPAMSDAVRRHLLQHDWPGNVRELEHFARRLVLAIEDEPALVHELPLPERMHRFEAEQIRQALAQQGGDVRSTVELLGIPRKTFYDKVSRYEIAIKEYRRNRDPS